ncbi:glutaredoxin family protein [Salipaludibacillus daqingensis]|uniref:glutaredoxin family protein n=1 Tax=Salipaludibacillus daqingensis TaxID=3041001 RepID=UPI0024738663|nr:glutaredoxin family protein [Salipaludibacillus daqingensis]
MTVYFYTKIDCPLCEKGLDKLQALQKESFFDIEIRDIYTNDEWLEEFQIRIPVVTTTEGTVLDEGIISYDILKRKLL